MKSKLVRSLVTIVLFCVFVSSLTGCGRQASTSNDSAESTNSTESPSSHNEADHSVTDKQQFNSDVIAIVNGEEIKKEDIGYYIYNNATIQMYIADSTTTQDIVDFDWSKKDDKGNTLKDIVIKNAIDEAINDTIFRQKAMELGYDINTAGNEASDLISNALEKQGEENFLVNANSLGISNADSYRRIYTNITVFEDVSREILSNPSKYIDDINLLSDYIGNKGATVQHVLIMNNTEKGDPLEIVNKVLHKAKAGEDFVQLMKEYNEDTGEEEVGYTFAEGEMVSSFENAAFNLDIGEISSVVESDYGYHIIKRNAGAYELQNYWASLSNVNIHESAYQIVDFDGVMEMVRYANSNRIQKGN